MKDSTAIILAIVLVSIIALPAIFEGVTGGISNLLGQLGEWVKYGFGGAGQSQTSLGWTFEYADGTTEEITPNSSMPLTVLYQDKELDYVGTAIWIKLTYTKQASSLVGTFDMDLYIDDKLWDVSDPHYPSATEISQTPPESGVWTKLRGGGLSGSVREVEKRDAGQFKSHTIKGIATIQMTVYMADGTSQQLEGTAQGTLTVNVVETATLDVEVRPNVASVYPTNLS